MAKLYYDGSPERKKSSFKLNLFKKEAEKELEEHKKARLGYSGRVKHFKDKHAEDYPKPITEIIAERKLQKPIKSTQESKTAGYSEKNENKFINIEKTLNEPEFEDPVKNNFFKAPGKNQKPFSIPNALKFGIIGIVALAIIIGAVFLPVTGLFSFQAIDFGNPNTRQGLVVEGINENTVEINENAVDSIDIENYNKIGEDPGYEVIIDSTEMRGENFIVRFHHNYNEELPVFVEGNINYGLNKQVLSQGETATLTVFNWGKEYFRIYVGENTEVFEFGENEEVDYTVNVYDSSANGVSTEIEFYEETSNELKGKKLGHEIGARVAKGKYTVKVKPGNNTVEEIELQGVQIYSSGEQTLNVDYVSEDKVEDSGTVVYRAYAIDPEQAVFETATVRAVAEGDYLYKCKEWDFATETCNGDWIAFMDLTPGQEYEFALSNDDPGFVEGQNPASGTPDDGSINDADGDENPETRNDYTEVQAVDDTFWGVGERSNGNVDYYGMVMSFDISSMNVNEQYLTDLNVFVLYCHEGANNQKQLDNACNGSDPAEGSPIGTQDVNIWDWDAGEWVNLGELRTNDAGSLITDDYITTDTISRFVNDSNSEVRIQLEFAYTGNDSWLIVDYAVLSITYKVTTTPNVLVTYPNIGDITGSESIDFNVSDANESVSTLTADIYYSGVQGAQENLIVSDLDLLSSSNCTDSDSNVATDNNCSYLWDTTNVVPDGNYYIDVNVSNGEDTNADSSDNSVYISNPGPWADTEFKRCTNIEITNAGSTTLTDFPAYIKLPYDSDMESDYSDLRFYSNACNDGGSLLDYEIEDYNVDSADIWVRIPSLPASGKTIAVYYKNSSAGSGENVTGVWDSNYLVVQHLQETSGTHEDSTSNNADFTNSGTTQDANGIVDGANELDGTGDTIEDADGENYINGLTAFTMSTWIKSDDIATDAGWVMTKTPDGSDNVLGIRYDDDGANGGGDDLIKTGITVGSNEQQLESSNNIQTTDWQHVVLVWESGSQLKLYVDGSEDTPTANDPAQTGSITGATRLLLGVSAKDTIGSSGWDGKIDEFRLSNKVRSADWINQSYQMIANQSTHVSFGSEEVYNNVPTVFIVNPNGDENVSGIFTIDWNALDSDEDDSLTFDLYYSGSQGAQENLIVSNLIFSSYCTDSDGNLATENNCQYISWDTTNIPSGTYYIDVNVSDDVNTVLDSSDNSFTIDNNAPNITINEPANGSTVQSQTVYFDVNHIGPTDVNLNSISVDINGITSSVFDPDSNCTAFDGNYSCSYIEPAFTSAVDYNLTVYASNYAGAERQEESIFNYQPNFNPNIEVVFPNGDENVSGTISIDWNSWDQDEGDSLTFDLYYSGVQGAQENLIVSNLVFSSWCTDSDGNIATENSCSRTWDTTAVPNGEYYIDVNVDDGSVTALDSSDNSFTIDNNYPVIYLNIPLNGSTTESNSVQFDANHVGLTDINLDTIRVDVNSSPSGDFNPVTHCSASDGNYTCSYTETGFSINSDYNITVFASTYAGLEDSNTSIFSYIANYAPVINVTNPNGDENVSGNYDINWNVSDQDETDTLTFDLYYSASAGTQTNLIATGLTYATYCTDGDSNIATTNSCGYPNWNTTTISDGDYYIDINVNDTTTTKIDSSDNSFTTDNTKPTTNDDAPQEWQNTSFNVNLSCNDGTGSGCQTTQYRIDSGTWTTGNTININTDGNHQIDYNSTDYAGNVETTNTTYAARDTQKPNIYIQTPANETTTQNQTINFDVNKIINADINIETITVDINSNPSTTFNASSHCTASDGNYTCSYTETTFNSNADYNLTIHGCDLAGNCDQNESIFTYIANYTPAITITNPNGDENVSGNYDINWNVSDADEADSLTFDIYYSSSAGAQTNIIATGLTYATYCTDSDGNLATENNCSYLWDTTTANDGTYYIDVNVSDTTTTNLDNSDNTFKIDNSKPKIYLQLPVNGSTTESQTINFDVNHIGPTFIDPSTISIDINGSPSGDFTAGTHCTASDGNFTCSYTETTFNTNTDYNVTIHAANYAGTYADQNESIFSYIANYSPIVTVTSPNGFEEWIGTHSITWDAADQDEADSLTFDIYYSANAGAQTNLIATGLTYATYCTDSDGNLATTNSCTYTNWNTTLIQDGNYYIDVNASDATTTNIDSSDNEFTVDNTPPKIYLWQPLNGTTTGSNTVQFDINKMSITDINTSTIAVDINGSPSGVFSFGSHCTSSDENYVCSYTETGFNTNADFNLTVYAYNTAGAADQNESIFSYTGINTAPDVNITAIEGYPDNQIIPPLSYERDGNVTIDFNAFDAENDSLTADLNYSTTNTQGTGTTIISGLILAASICDDSDFTNSTHCSWDWNVSNVADNNYLILISITDGSLTDYNASDNNFMIDNTKPTTTDDSPEGWQNSNITVTLICNDGTGSGCQTTQYRIDSGTWTTGNTININTDGNHQIDYNSTDYAGNTETTKTTHAALDTQQPNIYIQTPANGTTTQNQTITFDVNKIVNADINIETITVDINSNPSGDFTTGNCISSDGNYVCSYTETGLTMNADYNLTIHGCDNAGNCDQNETIFTYIANYNPQITITNPNGDENASGNHDINWNASDQDETDTLTFDLYYSSSAGAQTNIIATGLTYATYCTDGDGNLATNNSCGYPNWDTSPIQSGQYYIDVNVSDTTTTNQDSSDNAFTIDNNAPRIYLWQPLHGTAAGSQTVQFDVNKIGTTDINNLSIAVDLNGVSSAVFSFGSHCTASDSNYTCSYTETGINSSGADYNITVYAANYAGVKDENSSIFTYSPPNNAPTVSLNNPNGGESISGNYNIDWNAYDLDEDDMNFDLYYSGSQGAQTNIITGNLQFGTYCTDGDANSATYNNCSYSWDTTAAPNGIFYIDVNADDSKDTSIDSSDATFIVDNISPMIYIYKPLNAGTTNSNLVMFDVNSPGPSDVNIEAVSVDLNGSPSSVFNAGTDCTYSDGNYVCSYTETSFAFNNDYNLTVIADTNAGLSNQSESIFSYYNNPPNIEVVSPDGGESISGNYNIDWNAYDLDETDSLTFDLYYSSSQGAQTNIIVSGLAFNTYCTDTDGNLATENNCQYISWDTTSVINGNYYMDINGSDASFTSLDSSNASFTVDNTPPKIYLYQPLNGSSKASNTVSFDVNSPGPSDANIESITVDINGSPSAAFNANTDCTASDGNYVCQYNETSFIQNADYNVFITAGTDAGKTDSNTSIFSYIANYAPTITVTNPNVDKNVSGTHDINWNVSDADEGDSLTFDLYYSSSAGAQTNLIATGLTFGTYCSDGDTNLATNNSCGYPNWDTTNITSAQYYIDVNVSDGTTTNLDSSDNTFTIDNNKPQIYLNQPLIGTTTESQTVQFDINRIGKTFIDPSTITVDINGTPSAVFNSGTHCTPSDGNFICSYTETAFNTNTDYNVTVYASNYADVKADQNESIFTYIANYTPAITITNPNGDENISGNYDINWNISDQDETDTLTFDIYYSSSAGAQTNLIVSGLTYATYCTDGDSNIATTNSCGYPNWNTTTISDGDYYIDINVSDGTTTNLDSSDNSFTTDNTKPTTNDDAPQEWQNTSFNVNLSCNDGTGTGCQTTQYRIDNGSWQTGLTININTDGNHEIDYNSTDYAGNTETTKTTHAALDTQKPTIYIKQPLNESSTASKIVSFDVNSPGPSDVNLNSISIDINSSASTSFNAGSHCTASDGNYTCSYTETAFTQNVDYNLFIVAATEAGKTDSNESIFSFTGAILNNPPSIEVVNPDGGELISGNYSIDWNAYDLDENNMAFDLYYSASAGIQANLIASGIAFATYCTDADNNRATNNNCSYTLWDTTVIADGNYYIDVNADDGEDTSLDSSNASFVLDNSQPSITITSPSNGSQSPSNLIEFDLNHIGPTDINLDTVEVDLNGVSSTVFNASSDCTAFDGNYHCNYFETGIDTNGDYNVSVFASNLTGKERHQDSVFTYTGQPSEVPSIIILNPNGSQYVSGTISIDFNVIDRQNDELHAALWYSDNAVGFDNLIVADINLNSSGVCNDTNFLDLTTCNYNWDTTAVSDANFFIDANVWDTKLNSDLDSSDSSFEVDNEGPVTTADYNAGWQNTSQNVILNCNDPNSSGCLITKYRTDSDGSIAVSYGSWQTYSSPINFSSDGNYAMDFNSTDNEGNIEAAKTIYVLIDTLGIALTIKSPPSGGDSNSQIVSFDVNALGLSGIDPNSITIDINGVQSTAFNANTDCIASDGNYACSYYETGIDENSDYNVSITAENNAGTAKQEESIFSYTGEQAAPSQPSGDQSSLCGNGICGPGEDYENCPEDCIEEEPPEPEPPEPEPPEPEPPSKKKPADNCSEDGICALNCPSPDPDCIITEEDLEFEISAPDIIGIVDIGTVEIEIKNNGDIGLEGLRFYLETTDAWNTSEGSLDLLGPGEENRINLNVESNLCGLTEDESEQEIGEMQNFILVVEDNKGNTYKQDIEINLEIPDFAVIPLNESSEKTDSIPVCFILSNKTEKPKEQLEIEFRASLDRNPFIVDYLGPYGVEKNKTFIKIKKYPLEYELKNSLVELNGELYQKGDLFTEQYLVAEDKKIIKITSLKEGGTILVRIALWAVFVIMPLAALISLLVTAKKYNFLRRKKRKRRIK